jgi:hypothetical protein
LTDGLDEGRPSKRQCIPLDKTDTHFLRDEVRDVKVFMADMQQDISLIAEFLRGDIDLRLEAIVDEIRRLS